MSASNMRKEQILWIGEHAKSLFNNTNNAVLDKFDNYLLLYERNDDVEQLTNASYVNHAANRYHIEYDVESLKEPISGYLRDRKTEQKEGLIIGSPYELLMQSVIKSSFIPVEQPIKITESMLSEKSIRYRTNQHQYGIDLSQKSIVFLASEIPFTDIKKEGEEIMQHARLISMRIIIADSSVENLSEFLFRYQENQSTAIHETRGIKSF